MEFLVFLCTSFFQLQAYVMQVVLLEKMHIFFFFSVISHQWKLVKILSDFVASWGKDQKVKKNQNQITIFFCFFEFLSNYILNKYWKFALIEWQKE